MADKDTDRTARLRGIARMTDEYLRTDEAARARELADRIIKDMDAVRAELLGRHTGRTRTPDPSDRKPTPERG